MTLAVFPVRLSARELQARNVIARQGRGLALKLDTPATLDLRPLGADDGDLDHGLGASERLALEWGGARFELAVPRAALVDWLDARLRALGYDAAGPAALDDAWRLTALTLAGDSLLEALARAGRGEARLVPADEPDTPAPHRFAFEACFEPGDGQPPQVVHGRLACDGLGLMLMSGLVAAHGESARGPLADSARRMPLELRVTLGSSDVPLAELRRIARRDVILFTRPASDAAGVFFVSLPVDGGEYGLRVRVDNGALISLESPVLKMSENDPTPVADAAPALSLEQLPVRLSFDLGSVELTLAELEALQPGQGIALGRPLGSAVTIRANGACIGHGELVEIDGRAGVSVLELFAPAPAAQPAARSDDSDTDGDEA